MSMKLEGAKRGDLFSIEPEKIRVQEDLRGRHYQPTPKQIMQRAISLHLYGQIQPCEVRIKTIGDVKSVPVLNSGFTRCAAARLLRKGFSIPEDWVDADLAVDDASAAAVEAGLPPPKVRVLKSGDFIQDEKFLLRIVAVNCNDEEAFKRNLIENLERNDTTDIDDAHNHETLRRNHSYLDADIARFYGYPNQSKVARLKQLLQLPDNIQDMVHYGHLPTTAAIDLLARPREEWDAILEQSRGENGKVKGTMVRTAVRDNTLADATNSTEMHEVVTNGGNAGVSEESTVAAKPRSLAELRRFIDQRLPGDKQKWAMDPAIEKFLRSLRSYMGGKVTDQALENAVLRLLDAEATGVKDDKHAA